MKKKFRWYHSLIIAFGGVFTLVIAFCLGVIINGTCFKRYDGSEIGKNWMRNLDDEALLSEVIMPGSHDAGTYGMPWLGACQYLDIEMQLASGVRYFDIRVKKVNDDYLIYHGPINGAKFEPIIDKLDEFIENNPSETLILDFQHFENGAEDYVYQKVEEKLKDDAIYNDSSMSELEFVSKLKMKDARGKVLIFFGYGAFYAEDYIFSRNNDDCTKLGCALDSCYVTERNGASSENFINESLPYYVSKIQEKITREGFKGIFVLQCQLTDAALIFGPYSREKGHEKNMEDYIDALPSKDYFPLINIIMRDFMDSKKAQDIYNLNFQF